MTIGRVCDGINFLCNAVRVYKTVQNLETEEGACLKGVAGAQIAAISLQAAGFVMEHQGASSRTLEKTKIAETACHLTGGCFAVIDKVTSENGGSLTAEAVLAPLASATYSYSQAKIHGEQANPAVSASSQSKVDSYVRLGRFATKIQIAAEADIVSRFSSANRPLYAGFCRWLTGRSVEQPLQQENFIDMLALTEIPSVFENDVVFSRYTCSINGGPVRDPVADPTNQQTLYERRTILRWLEHNQTSPITREPLFPE